MDSHQPGILEPVPPLARYLTFSSRPGADPRESLKALRDLGDGREVVVGIGPSVALALDRPIDGLRGHPRMVGPGVQVPSTPGALWCWLRGKDRGEILHRGRRILQAVRPGFALEQTIDAFEYGPGLDLTGYEDGTENPTGKKAVETAIVSGGGEGLDGSSFVAVQTWIHDLERFEAMGPEGQDRTIGRRRSDNEEMEDAPPSAHVKRAEQESYEPEAFVLRRSMPWAGPDAEGLVFVAFGRSFDAFEAILRRMVGGEDGTVDALFGFTRPVSGSYYWCPPMTEGRLDLRALGVD